MAKGSKEVDKAVNDWLKASKKLLTANTLMNIDMPTLKKLLAFASRLVADTLKWSIVRLEQSIGGSKNKGNGRSI